MEGANVKTLGKMISGVFKQAPRRLDPHRKAREEAKALAKKHGIEIERLKDGGFNVWPPKSVTIDPHEGDHFVNEWDEVLVSVRLYASLVTAQISADTPGASTTEALGV
jgi:hypothetical protein